MTIGNLLAILISLAALYGAYAFIRTKLIGTPTFPFTNLD
jgi:hypothetical protein